MGKTNLATCGRFYTNTKLKLKSLREYYLRLLQLYMPWQDKNQLKECHHSYEEKWKLEMT